MGVWYSGGWELVDTRLTPERPASTAGTLEFASFAFRLPASRRAAGVGEGPAVMQALPETTRNDERRVDS